MSVEKAQALIASDPAQAASIFNSILHDDESDIKVKEKAIEGLTDIHVKNGKADDLKALLTEIRPFLNTISKAKAAKIVRTSLSELGKIEGTEQMQITFCEDSIEWAKKEKHVFLRHRVQTRLAALYYETTQYAKAASIVEAVTKEVKPLDDKLLLTEILLIDSRVHHALRNIPKAKATLTAARTSANAIYCPPNLQAQIDMQAGTLHADEKDYKTAYSYYFEAFEAYNSLDEPYAVNALKYMLMCKIMTNKAEEVESLITGRLKYAGRNLDAMNAIAKAYHQRSLSLFEAALEKYKKELKGDLVVETHLSFLYDTLLEQNLSRIIEPYSNVEISHVANAIKLDCSLVEKKLSQMILDKKVNGILDQGERCLILFDDPAVSGTYPAVLETIENMSNVVDSLYEKARSLN